MPCFCCSNALIKSVFQAGTMVGESRSAYQLADCDPGREGAVE